MRYIDLFLQDIDELPNSFNGYSALIFNLITDGCTTYSYSGINSYECFTLQKIILNLKSIIYKTGYFSDNNTFFNLFKFHFFGEIQPYSFSSGRHNYIKYSDKLKYSFYWTIASLKKNDIDINELTETITVTEQNKITRLIIYSCKILSQLFITNNIECATQLLIDCDYQLNRLFEEWKETSEGKNKLKHYTSKKGKDKQQLLYYFRYKDLQISRINNILLLLNNSHIIDKHTITMEVWKEEIKEIKHKDYINDLIDRRKVTSHKDYKGIIYWVNHIIDLELYLNEYEGDDKASRIYYSHSADIHAKEYHKGLKENKSPYVDIIINNHYTRITL